MEKNLSPVVFRICALSMMLSCFSTLHLGQTKPLTSYEKSKSSRTNKLLAIIEKLERVARLNSNGTNGKHTNGYLSQHSISQIRMLLSAVSDSEQLTKLGLMCGHIAYPQYAEHVAYDAVFDCAMWEAAGRLAKRTDDDAIKGLELLKQSHGTDGHPSEEFRELIEDQRQLVLRTQNKLR